MTTTLIHPDAEDLSRFIEGTLEEPERAAIVEHVADCDDCRIIVVDASEFFAKEHPVSDRQVAQSKMSGRWWMSAAAAIAIAVGGVWIVEELRDPLAPVKEASSHSTTRLVSTRLSDFPYALRPRVNRGSGEPPDAASQQLAAVAEVVSTRSGDSIRMQHARGIALLLVAQENLAEVTENTEKDNEDRQSYRGDRDRAIAMLRSAAAGAPDDESYQTDLAAALIATGEKANINQALEIYTRVLAHDKRSLEALFNRAIAFEGVDTNKAIAAYQAYLQVDSSSRWADEARERFKYLSDELKPQP
ncbi:MAG TPA: zf-HC2 domain-containing protein [Thermoanaerobaculia bacterium]|jgi:hypothetical protein|nr:zf-HC2 domain-containing protein [Thermoanaerobaculia bacterium]